VSDIAGAVISVNTSDGQIDVVSGFWADVDNDGDVDIIDIQLVAARWNTQLGDDDYDPIYDLDNEGEGDGYIDIIDIQLVASWWNQDLPLQGERIIRLARSAPPLTLRLIPGPESNALELSVEDAAGIGAFQFDLVFPDRAPDVGALEPGTWFRQSGRTAVLLGPGYSPSSNRVTFAAYSYGAETETGYNGDLMRISFAEEISAGVMLENLRFADAAGSPLGPVTVENLLETGSGIMPRTTALMQNFPNPFNTVTEITYTVAEQNHVTLNIYDSVGRLVRVLVNEHTDAGQYRVTWNGKDDSGAQLPSGIYLSRLVCGSFAESKKMLLLK